MGTLLALGARDGRKEYREVVVRGPRGGMWGSPRFTERVRHESSVSLIRVRAVNEKGLKDVS